MSILATTATVAATAIIAAFALTHNSGPSIKTEIEIDAPAAEVWKELANTSAYPEWNPFVRSISGELEVGEKLQVTVGADDSTQMDFTPDVLVASENEELRWVGRLGFKGIFDGEHYFILKETDQGTTVLHHGETFTGLLGYPLLALIREDTQNGFLAMNEALKSRAETNS